MVRIILGVIVGFIVWSIVWVGSDQVLQTMSPGWFGAYSQGAEKSMLNGTEFVPDATIALISLLRSFLTSILAGLVAAMVAGERRRSTMVLGVLLLVVGLAVEIFTWRLAPAWYHILFLLFLVPMTILGGRLKPSAANAG
jgi:hypothetical protein